MHGHIGFYWVVFRSFGKKWQKLQKRKFRNSSVHEALGYTLVLDGEECKMWVELRFKEPKMLFCPCWRFLSTLVTTTLEHRVRGIPPQQGHRWQYKSARSSDPSPLYTKLRKPLRYTIDVSSKTACREIVIYCQCFINLNPPNLQILSMEMGNSELGLAPRGAGLWLLPQQDGLVVSLTTHWYEWDHHSPTDTRVILIMVNNSWSRFLLHGYTYRCV